MKKILNILYKIFEPSKNLYQCRNRLLLKNVLLPAIKQNQVKSFLILCLRFFSLGKLCHLKHSTKNLKFKINNNSKYFILDLREAVIDFHHFLLLSQFFSYLSEKFEIFEIWVDENSFRYNEYKNFTKEIDDFLNYLSGLYNFKTISKNKSEKYFSDASFLKISYTEGYYFKDKPFSNNEVICDFFIKELGFESRPINYSLDQNLSDQHAEVKTLNELLKNNFSIIFYPTYDEYMGYEKKSRIYGVISQENFEMMKKIYLELINYIEKKKINNIKIVLFNKKSLNWPINENCIDLRNFENYNLNFPNILGLFNDSCKWTLGSEGTVSYSLVMCSKLKHAMFVDNTHWPGTKNSNTVVPIFYSSRNEISYKDKPNQYVPISIEEVLNKILADYKDFCNKVDNVK